MNKKQRKENSRQEMNIAGLLKRSFWAGVATLFPLFVTIYAVILLFRFADHFAGKYINSFLMRQYSVSVPGIGLIVLLIFLVVAGLLSRIFLGRWLASMIDKLFHKMPLIAHIYPSAKKLSDFLFSEEESKKKFRKVVLVEFPTQGSWSIGFITNDKLDAFQQALSDDFVCVFVPMAPAPFSGFVYWAAKKKVKEMDMSVDQAIKFVLSGGVVSK